MASVYYQRPHALIDIPMHYCPGCTHSTVHKLIAEAIDELGIEGKMIGVASVGCTYNSYEYFNCDMVQAAHGRAPAVATGIKRSLPDSIVFSYQGDGDLAAIGTAEIIHAAARSENISIIFVNNAIYGMTSGQMAPTTLIKQVTQTSPRGRDPLLHGYPLKVCELLSAIDGVVYAERVSMHDVKNTLNAKKAIKNSFITQINNLGFSIVEVLSTCPSNWGMKPDQSLAWIKESMIPVFPLGIYKGKRLENQ
jgi:2-oxoglutarate/2-oxoacid ferredoxin oxidoreductase subunit beta